MSPQGKISGILADRFSYDYENTIQDCHYDRSKYLPGADLI